jgi:hypothetical protein
MRVVSPLSALSRLQHAVLGPPAPPPLRQVGDWELSASGAWSHRPWFKVLVNTFLRRLQLWCTDRPFVIYTRTTCAESAERPPEVLGYGFGRVLHRRNVPRAKP